MKEPLGEFYFFQTRNGHLIGEFINPKQTGTESADAPCNWTAAEGFVSCFRSTWQEDGQAHYAELTIFSNHDSNNQTLQLEWKENGKTTFLGDGTIVAGSVLKGEYRHVG